MIQQTIMQGASEVNMIKEKHQQAERDQFMVKN
jgi:hypothetical protein